MSSGLGLGPGLILERLLQAAAAVAIQRQLRTRDRGAAQPGHDALLLPAADLLNPDPPWKSPSSISL